MLIPISCGLCLVRTLYIDGDTVNTAIIYYTDSPIYLLTHFTYLLTYLLTPWSSVRLEKLTGSQPVKKFPPFYGTRRFITIFTSVRLLSLS